MKTVSKKLLSLLLVAVMLVSAVPFQAFAAEVDETVSEVVDEGAAQAVITDKLIVTFVDSDGSTLSDAEGNDCVVEVKYGKTIPANKFPDKYLTLADGEMIFSHWVYEGTNVQFKRTESIHQDLTLQAVYKYPAVKVTFKANGGKADFASKSYEYGTTYADNGGLPNATREHYDFLGWYDSYGVKVEEDTMIASKAAYSLTAQWALTHYNVTFEAYTDPEGADESGWEAVDSFTFTDEAAIEAKSVLSTANGTFPTAAEISELFALDGWTIDGWEIVESGASVTAGKTTVTGNITIRPIYKKSITLYACDEGNTTRKFTVTLGKRVPTLPNPGTREGYAFVGWYLDADASEVVSLKADLATTSKHPYYYPALGNFYAGWADATLIYLYIYTNGNTDEHVKLVRYYEAPANGFDLTQINMYSIYSNYGKFDDEGDESYGWFNAAQWNNYRLGKPANEFEYVDADYLESDDIHEFYIMLIDNGNNTANNNNGTGGAGGYGNTNNNTKDPSNPATGDMIFVPMFVMMAAAAAAAFLFLNKKRIVK